MKAIVTNNGRLNPNLPTDEVYIGRGSIYGNPFKIGLNGATRSQVISQFKDYFLDRLLRDTSFREAVHALKGKKLACFCTPLPCHGDVIAEYLNGL